MSVHVRVAVPAEHFVFDPFPSGVRIEFERCVPLSGNPTPCLWVSDDGESWSDDGADTFGDIELLARVDGERLVRTGWPSERSDVFDALRASEATCLSGFRERGVWNLRLRFPSTVSVSDWYRACPGAGSCVTVRRVQTEEPPRTAHGSKLTGPQRDALRTALETGYFTVPRRISLDELSDRLGVSDAAVSQRLRRGIESLLVDHFGDLRP
jgi:predicted DNA binding protein